MKIRILHFTLLMLFSFDVYSYAIPANSSPGTFTLSSTGCHSPESTIWTTGSCATAYCEARQDSCSSGLARPWRNVCPAGSWSDLNAPVCYTCPAGSTRIAGTNTCDNGINECPDGSTPDSVTKKCPVVCPEAGTPAGIDEGADGPPGYATKCYGECSIIGYEYFQRTDNDLWVISYIYTGTECGDGDPMGEPTAPPGSPVPDTVSPTTDTDTDGDGIPDHNDPDIDGDGIPNSQDTDQDGDGVDDVDDPTPQGRPPKDEPSKANVGTNCEQIPTCSGDAIQCAQLIEIWRLRCKTTPANTEEISDNLDNDIIGQVNSDGESFMDIAQSEIVESLDDDSGISLSTDLQNPITSLFTGITCTDIGFEFKDTNFTISCTQTQTMRDVMAFLLYLGTLVYLYQLARKPVEN